MSVGFIVILSVSLVILLIVGILNSIMASNIAALQAASSDPLSKGYSFAVGAACLDFIGMALIIASMIVIAIRLKNKQAIGYAADIFLFVAILFIIISTMLSAITTALIVASNATTTATTIVHKNRAYETGVAASIIGLISIIILIISIFFIAKTSAASNYLSGLGNTFKQVQESLKKK